ncbi:hypothetical protein TSAR_001729 [Trichomalopsis sarcophagae]|uniref:Ig-like domain-containing protein n=1 Tax=Trichomalopsis sarcophagae TaxID=543379 RepID=A0A232F585_9HYME|nr:hypothetical protein TSAR_001729 [Trichomalopsis sarcophagae]
MSLFKRPNWRYATKCTHRVRRRRLAELENQGDAVLVRESEGWYLQSEQCDVAVAQLPSHRPSISGLRSKYRVNDTLKLNCSLKYSKPAANLTWYINNKQASISFITYSTANHSEGILALSCLIFPITPDSFFNSSIKIRCSASIYDIYWQSTEVSAEEDKFKYSVAGSSSNVIGINYHQPPPNFQLGQKKLDGEIDIKESDDYHLS